MPNLALVAAEDWHFVSHRLHLGLAARSAGYAVTVITRCRRKAADLEKGGLRSVNFEMERRGTSLPGVLAESIRLRRILSRERYDIVHLISLRAVVVGGLASMFMIGPKLVLSLNGLGYLFTDGRGVSRASKLLRNLLPFLLRRGHVIVQNSEDLNFVRRCGVGASRVRLIRGAGVDIQRFRASTEPCGLPIVMLPSRLLRDKGVGEFVKAAELLRAGGVKARFVLVGDPDPENPSTVSPEECNKWAAQGVVEIWGHQEHMEEVLPQSTVVCLPSYREGLPKSLLEAMACARPCVTTDTSGCREVIRHGDNGLLVPVKDADALADAIRQMLADRQMRKRMGFRGRERAVKEFADALVDAQTLALYDELWSAKT